MGIDAEMTALADAIRSKSGTSGKLSIAGMTTAVNNIEIGSNIDFTGVTVTADTMLDGVVAVDANGSKVTGNIKTVTASSDGTKVTVPVGFIAKEQSFTITTDDTGGYDTSSVTATADTMLSGVVAIGRNGETIVGNIKTVVPSVTANVFTVKKGFVAEDTELEVPEAGALTVSANVVTVPPGFVKSKRTATIPEATVTETETTATVSPGYVPQELSFDLGKAGEEIQYGYINDKGLFQQLDLSGDAPVADGDPVYLANAGVFVTGVDEADYTIRGDYFDPDEPFNPDKPLTFTLMSGSPRATVNILSFGESPAPAIDLYYRYGTSGEWHKYTGTEEFSLIAGGYSSMQFWNTSSTFNTGEIGPDVGLGYVRRGTLKGYRFQISDGWVGCSGNIASLINYSSELTPCCFARLFYGNDTIQPVENTLAVAPALPFTKLADACYYEMFCNCGCLAVAPELPVLELATACYEWMFKDCVSLVTAPELPATQLAPGCYGEMFYLCISLTTAPELPATQLADHCYDGMFAHCDSLVTAPELPATQLAKSCYTEMFYVCTSLTTAPELPATQLADHCYLRMFRSCTSLTTAPELPATQLAPWCYGEMFGRCLSLTTAPELPATQLADRCYEWMFKDCTSLNRVTIKAIEWPVDDFEATAQWLSGVSETGTFYKSSALPEERGISRIPDGWTVVNID